MLCSGANLAKQKILNQSMSPVQPKLQCHICMMSLSCLAHLGMRLLIHQWSLHVVQGMSFVIGVSVIEQQRR